MFLYSLCYRYRKCSPPKNIVLNAWLPPDGILKRFDYESFNFNNGLIHWWDHYWEAMGTRGGTYLKRLCCGPEVHIWSFFSSSLVLSHFMLSSCYEMNGCPLPYPCTVLFLSHHRTQSNGAKELLTKTIESVR